MKLSRATAILKGKSLYIAIKYMITINYSPGYEPL
jgi:hypothetical protein